MNRRIILLVVLLQSFGSMFAQTDSVKSDNKYILYSLFVNIVPNDFNFPLIGFVNLAQGNHNYPQIGFINTTLKNYKTAQIGFVNTNIKETQGVQIGFVNTSMSKLEGAQVGFVNTSWDTTEATQMGFVNISKKSVKGVQVGFVNYADTIEGIPIGFLSIVRKGGYKAFEISTNSLSYINLSFKIGVPKFYTIFQLNYNPNFTYKIGSSIGIGSLIPLGGKFYFNPESLQAIITSKDRTQSLNLNFGYKIGNHFQFTIGPSIAWLYKTNDDYPWFSIKTYKLNTSSKLLIGGNFGISYNF